MSTGTALPAALLATIEAAFNAYLGLDAENAARLERLQGKVIGLELRGLSRRMYLLPQQDSVIVLGVYEGEADAVISGSPVALMAMHHPDNRSRSLFSGAVEIRGEVGVGQALQAILDDMDIDWEEMLSRYTGDIVAHQLGNLVRGANRWLSRSAGVIEQDLGEYLQEEARSLPPRLEVQDWMNEVDAARSDLDRLEARIKRIAVLLETQDKAGGKRMIRPRVAWRLFHINFVLARHGLDEIVLATHLFRPVRFLKYLSPFYWLRPERGDHGARIRRALEDLGPIFVKFGQLLSTRADLLPEDIARELARLQDAVPPFAGATARRIVENAYKRPISEVFAEFDDKPLASASIAQVHAARLKDGRDVVVKVVRPNIEPVIGRDVELLKTLAALAERYWPEGRRLRPREVVAEFEKTLVDELDLTREAANASELRRNFEGSRLLYVPAIDWDHTFRRVMVMERITGIPIGDMATLRARGVNMKKLAERGVEIFFTQVFRDSFFHADMHPGNIFVDASDPENPRYVAVDFGIMGTLNPTDQHYLAANFLAFFNRDYRKVAELHVESLWVPATTRVDEFEAAIRTVSEPIFGRPLKEISFGHFLLRLFQTARRFDMRIQPQLVLLQKTLLAIEGLGRQLYPDLDLWQTAKPFLERWMSEQVGPRAAWKATRKAAPDWGTQIPEIPGLIHQVFSRAARGELQLRWQSEELQQLRQEVQESRRGTMRAITGAALFVGGCVLLAGDFSLPVLSQYSAGFAWLSLATGALMMFTGRGGRA